MEFLHQCGQSQGRNVVFPNQLGKLPPFWTWIRISLTLMKAQNWSKHYSHVHATYIRS
jgi:hypothetical protein